MRLGLIARADNSGLGTQCWGYARALKPSKVLVIDVGHFRNDTTHANKATYRDRYPGAQFYCGWRPPETVLTEFLEGLDCVLTAECAYNNELYALAKRMGVRVVLAPNYEFLDTTARPDVWAMPSLWHYDDVPFDNKLHLPVPIETDRFTSRTSEITADPCFHFLHLVGRPAAHDRNGTLDLLKALEFVESNINVRISCQDTAFLQAKMLDRIPRNVCVVFDHGDAPNYWDNYWDGDVLLMPRRFGGLCLPVNEALGAGMPVVMPDISPNNTWLPSDWLVPATHQGSFRAKQHVDLYSVDHRALAATIDRFASDAGFYAKAKTEAAELRDQNSWTALKPMYEKVLYGE